MKNELNDESLLDELHECDTVFLCLLTLIKHKNDSKSNNDILEAVQRCLFMIEKKCYPNKNISIFEEKAFHLFSNMKDWNWCNIHDSFKLFYPDLKLYDKEWFIIDSQI